MASQENPVYPKAYLYRRIVLAKLYMDEHYMESIDLNLISDEAAFSKFHFIRLFSQIYGQTPHQYLKKIRIEKAIELLKSGKSVTEACYLVGFESPSSFSGLFRRSIGISPTAFTKRHFQHQQKINLAPLDYIPGCFAEKKGWKRE